MVLVSFRHVPSSIIPDCFGFGCVFGTLLKWFCQPVLCKLHKLVRYAFVFVILSRVSGIVLLFADRRCDCCTKSFSLMNAVADAALVTVMCFDIRRFILSMKTSRGMYLVSARVDFL